MTCRDVTLPHTSLPPVLNMVQQNTYFLLVRNKPFFYFFSFNYTAWSDSET